jgi:tetratricopeptide (TPR) repeat protein
MTVAQYLLIAVFSLFLVLLIFWNRSRIISKAKSALFGKQEKKIKEKTSKESTTKIQDEKIEISKAIPKYSGKDITKGIKRSEILLSHGEDKEAEQILVSILSVEENHIEAHILLASMYLRKKRYAKAEAMYRKLLELHKTVTPAIYSNLAFCLFEQNNLEEAASYYKKALKKEPKNVKRYTNYAQVLFVTKQFTEAIKLFKKAIKLSPRNTEILFMLADTYREAQMFAQAKMVYEKILDYEPYNVDAKEEVGRLELKGY